MSFWVDFLGLGQAEIGVLGLGLTKLLTKNIIIFLHPRRIRYFLTERIRLSL